MSRLLHNVVLSCVLLCAFGVIAAQDSAPAQPAAPSAVQQAAPAPVNPDKAAQQQLTTASKEAAGEEKEENAEFKYNGSVLWLSRATGLNKEVAYWLFVSLNFAILAGAIYFLTRTGIAAAYRNRTAAIQKGIEEARKASAEANVRLSEIEGKLAKLDSEIDDIRKTAQADFSAEEQRIQKAAEEDARRVIENAQQEIATATRVAQRDLKVYAADLAVSLAEQKIKVDAVTDEELIRGFVGQLGKDGK